MAKKGKLRKIIYVVTLIILAAVFLFSAFMLIRYYVNSQESQQTYAGLQALRGDYTRPVPDLPTSEPDSNAPTTTETVSPLVTVSHPQTGEAVELLPEMAELFLLNPDLVGWLTIPGTNVDYPVVQRRNQKDYYLHRDYYGNSDTHGCIYAQEDCDVVTPSDNVILYGHRMKDLTMFGQVGGYEKKDFWQEHPYLYFDTLTERHTYEVISVFVTTASVGKGFSYHQFVDAADAEDFYSFLGSCNAYRLYDTGLSAQYGDKLLTLSTCEYGQENGRLVVVAKRID